MENVTHSKLIPKLLALSSLCLHPKRALLFPAKPTPLLIFYWTLKYSLLHWGEQEKVLRFSDSLCHSRILLNGHPTRFGKVCMYQRHQELIGVGYCCLSSRVFKSNWDCNWKDLQRFMWKQWEIPAKEEAALVHTITLVNTPSKNVQKFGNQQQLLWTRMCSGWIGETFRQPLLWMNS